MLLQQTRVAQAAPYYERLVARFPNVRSLARARVGSVLKAWQGAGYYARARRLHAAARELLRSRAGGMPRSVEELEALPGVGPYVARAIAALAFDAPVVALEANGLRVAARWTREEGDLRQARVRERLARALGSALPRHRPGAFNEAVMELGETVCRPQHPDCERCPVAGYCRAFRETADPGALPRRPPRRRRPHVRAAVVVLSSGSRWLVQRRSPDALLGGLWEFPGGKIRRGERPEQAARRELREETGLAAGALAPVGVVRHAYSHFSVELHVFAGAVRGPHRLRPGDRRWATPAGLARLPVPKATEKIVRLLRAASVATASEASVRRSRKRRFPAGNPHPPPPGGVG